MTIKSIEKFAVKSSVFYYQNLVMRQLNPFHENKEWCCFLTGFLITNSLNIHISSKKRLCSTVDLFSVVRVILFNMYKIYKRFDHLQGGFEVFKLQYFKFLCQKHIQNLLKHPRWSFLLKAVKSFQKNIHFRYLGSE